MLWLVILLIFTEVYAATKSPQSDEISHEPAQLAGVEPSAPKEPRKQLNEVHQVLAYIAEMKAHGLWKPKHAR